MLRRASFVAFLCLGLAACAARRPPGERPAADGPAADLPGADLPGGDRPAAAAPTGHPSGPLPAETEARLFREFKGSPEERRAARKELNELVAKGHDPFPTVQKMSGSGTFNLEWEAVNFLGYLGDPRAIPLLVEEITRVHADQETDHHVRWRSIWALAALRNGDTNEDIRRRLHAHLDGPDPVRRFRAALALGSYGDGTVIGILEDSLSLEDDFNRWEAVYCLRRVHGQESVRKLLGALQNDPSERVRGEAALTLILIGDPAAAGSVLGALDDASAEVRRRVAGILPQLKDARVCPTLRAHLEGERNAAARDAMKTAVAAACKP